MMDLKERAGIAMSVRGQFTDPIADPKVTLGALAFANDLGRLLVRIKAAQQAKPESIRRATLLLAQMVRTSGRFRRGKFSGLRRDEHREQRAGGVVERANSDVIERFALRVLDEWVNDQCVKCQGRRTVRRLSETPKAMVRCVACMEKGRVCVAEERIPFCHGRNGPLVFREYETCSACNGMRRTMVAAPAAAQGRQICPDCSGAGKRLIDDPARAQAIGVTLKEYQRNWSWRFQDMLGLLDAIDGSVSDTMRRQLRE